MNGNPERHAAGNGSGMTPLRVVGLSLLLNALLCLVLFHPWKVDGYDQIFYYAQARSLAYDGDLYILNDLKAEMPAESADRQDRIASTYSPRRLPIPFSIGQPALTLPLHLAVRGAAGMGLLSAELHAALARAVPDVMGLGMSVATLAVLAWAGLRLGGRMGLALNAALYAASPMPYYFLCDSSTAHGAAIFWSAMLLALLLRRPPVRWSPAADGALLGTVGAWLVLSRWQTLPVLAAALAWRLWTRRREGRSAALRFLSGAVLCAAPLFLGQYLLVQANNPLGAGAPPLLATYGHRPPEYLIAALFGVLLSDFNGLFYVHPALLVGACAAGAAAWRMRGAGGGELPAWAGPGAADGPSGARIVAWGALGVLGLATVTNALVLDWWGSYAFGGRRFDFALPWLGAAAALAAARLGRRGARLVLGALLLLAAWNVLTALRFRITNLTYFDYWNPRLTALLFRHDLVFRFSAAGRMWPLQAVPVELAIPGAMLLFLHPPPAVPRLLGGRPGALRRFLAPALAGLSGLLLAGAVAAASRTEDTYAREAAGGVPVRAPAPASFISGGEIAAERNPFGLFYRTDEPEEDRLRRDALRACYHRMMEFKANRHPLERKWFKIAWEEQQLSVYGTEPAP